MAFSNVLDAASQSAARVCGLPKARKCHSWNHAVSGMTPCIKRAQHSRIMLFRASRGAPSWVRTIMIRFPGLSSAQAAREGLLADLDARLTDVPFVAGGQFSVADITAIVTVDFATKAIGLPIPEAHAGTPQRSGVRIAYRRFGKAGGVPLVLLMHFTGTMDHWDPAAPDGFAATLQFVRTTAFYP
jgi:hypothetical protein